MFRHHRGFTLIELLVVVSIIGIISSVIFFNLGEGSAQARDAQRQADLRNVEAALESYRQDEGRYPPRCTSGDTTWSGEVDSAYQCLDGSNQYIVGLAPKYIATLPIDPRSPDANTGYVYTVNTAGTVYKFMALETVESEVVTMDHEFKSCEISNRLTGVACADTDIPPESGTLCFLRTCDYVSGEPTNPPLRCRETNDRFQSSYAVWGGFGQPTVAPGHSLYGDQIEQRTEAIICQ